MKKILVCLLALTVIFSAALTVMAADGNVIYSGDSGSFIFQPGSEYSPTDLFPDFKDVMPGDVLTQRIAVRNDASNQVKVKIYMRALGAQPESEEFLSQLKLKVTQDTENVMFDAAASETAQLTEWLCLGTLYSGGETELNVELTVPVTLDNTFKNQIGYLDWEFMVEEYPVEPSDPIIPTGDNTPLVLYGTLAVVSAAAVTVLLVLLLRKKEKKTENG